MKNTPAMPTVARKVRVRVRLSEDELKSARRVLFQVWNYIGHDCGDIPNSHAVEACLDADRPRDLFRPRGDPAVAVVESLVKQHGFNPLVAYLARRVSLN